MDEIKIVSSSGEVKVTLGEEEFVHQDGKKIPLEEWYEKNQKPETEKEPES